MVTYAYSTHAPKSHWIMRTVATSVARFFRCQRQYAYLDELPDHLLRDVGLNRSDIAEARKDYRLFWPTHR